jgi:hypothetical protein
MSNQQPLQHCRSTLVLLLALAQWTLSANAGDSFLDLRGVAVVPHIQSEEMRYRREPDRSLGAWVQLFLVNRGSSPLSLSLHTPVRLRDKTPDELLAAGDWTWHEFPSAWTNSPLELPPGAMTVWSFNGKNAPWGADTSADLLVSDAQVQCDFAKPRVWLSSVTFLGDPANPFPNSLIFHVANEASARVRLEACRLWLPRDNLSWRALLPQPWRTNLLMFPKDGLIPSRGRGGARVHTGPLPLTYTALEVKLSDDAGRPFTLWSYLRIKREAFDISGGWVASGLHGSNTLQVELYLKTLRRMHVNTGMHQEVPGYSDKPLYEKYPLKYMNRLQPFDHYDTDAILPRIHAVEFMGEPQYGGGRPVPPMAVWRAFAPYQATRLPTSVTHSEERVWRFYAGLSDYPHYDAYRVTAPSPDAWSKYDRWRGQTIRWGAPLETIGDMTRSLRELNRPRPIACWSQGAHEGWEVYGGRKRTSPTPDELRLQAYHALASRITSLYWFNLSLKSLVKFRDLIDPITRVNREIQLMADLLLEGDAFEYRRLLEAAQPSWDLASVTGPNGGLLFANDLAYVPDEGEKVFKFSTRDATLVFKLPAYLPRPAEVFRLDADGPHDVKFSSGEGRVTIQDRVNVAAVYVISPTEGLRQRMKARHTELLRFEQSLDFDPAARDPDFEKLRQLLP